MRVCLSKDGEGRHFLVSRLVAAAFCENDDPERKNTIDHIDGNKKNNAASNLCWMSLGRQTLNSLQQVIDIRRLFSFLLEHHYKLLDVYSL